MIEWPSAPAFYSELLFGAVGPADLDRMFVAHLQQQVGTTPAEPEDSMEALKGFVRENGWPSPNASNELVLAWLIALHVALASICCCSIWQMPAGRGLAVEVHGDRYL